MRLVLRLALSFLPTSYKRAGAALKEKPGEAKSAGGAGDEE